MPASEKRIAANRANAAKSTGPRTPEGKERSKMNAVTHGLTAQASVLPGEDRGQLEELSAALMRELKPEGIVQRLIAERVVSLAWKLRRAARAEEAMARQLEEDRLYEWERGNDMWRAGGMGKGELFARPEPRDAAKLLADSFGEDETGHKADGALVRLSQYELKLDTALRAAVRDLRALQKAQRQREDADDAEPGTGVATPPAQNEPNAEQEDGSESQVSNPESQISDVRSDVRSDVAEAATSAGEKTNPMADAPPAAEVVGVTEIAGGSSAPVPRTPSSPHPGQRR